MAESAKWELSSTDSCSAEEFPDDQVYFFDDICEVCYACDKVGKFQSIAICNECKSFFEKSVKERDVCSCVSYGICSTIPEDGYRCSFCYLSKCFDVGLKAEKVGATSDTDCFLIKARENIPDISWEDLDDDDSDDHIEAVRSALHFAVMTASHQITNHPVVRRLEPTAKEELLERCKRRGAIADLIVRSLHCHDVLRFYNKFFDPCVCSQKQIRDLTMEMLNLIRQTWEDDLQIPDNVFRESLTFMRETIEVDQRIVTNYGERMENILQHLSICEEIAFPLVECTTSDLASSSSTSEESLEEFEIDIEE